MPASQIPTKVVLFASRFFIFLLSNMSCYFQSEYSKMNHYQLSGGAFDRKYVESLQFHKYIPLFILGSFVIFGWVFTHINSLHHYMRSEERYLEYVFVFLNTWEWSVFETRFPKLVCVYNTIIGVIRAL